VPYAKTSERAEQRALRERMRALGLTHPQIAFEFARRYNMRPRASWRHAHGWSLKQAAERITACAAQAGVNPDGTTVAMTGPHLCEVESWPGYGSVPAGRRPTPYLLSLLATAYDCAIADLLDLADYEHMRPADLLVLGRTADARRQARAGAGAAGQTAPPRLATVIEPPPGQDRQAAPPPVLPDGPAAPAAAAPSPALALLAEALLSPGQPCEAPVPLADHAARAWRLRQQARYRKLAAELPPVLLRARGGEPAVTGDRRLASGLTHLYNAASSLATALGSAELAGIAADRAVRTAAEVADPLLNGAAAYRLANVLLSAGQLESARLVAISAADQLRPALAVTRSHTATWGALLATAALAAAKASSAAEARELLGASKVAADLLGSEQADLFSIFGPANWLIHAVNIAVELDDGAGAVRRAEQIPLSRLPLFLAERRTFLLVGKARGYALRGDQASAAQLLLEADQAAPEEVRRNPHARSLAASLAAAGPVRSQALRELAARMNGNAGQPATGPAR